MKEKFEPKIEKPKYPELEDLVDVELPQEVMREINSLIFSGELSGVSVELTEDDFKSDLVKYFFGENNPLKKIYDLLTPYFNERIMDVLCEKSTALLTKTQYDEQETQEIINWYNKIKEDAKEVFKMWLIMVIRFTRDCEEAFKEAESSELYN